MRSLIAALLILGSSAAYAQSPNIAADAAFCKSITEQAMAQRDQFRTPSAVVGPIQPSAGTPPQLVFGIQTSLSDDRKAGLTMKAAHTACALYSATTEAQMHLLYAMPGIEKEVLKHRLQLIEATSNKLDGLIADSEKLIEAQNLTRPAVYALTQAKIRLDESRTAALTGITSPYVPPLSDTPLRVLVADKLVSDNANQQAMVKLTKQTSWDVTINGGVHRQLSQVDSGQSATGAYGEFSLNYNLGRKSIGHHLDKSVDAYNEWKKSQFDDVEQQSLVLQKQMVDTVAIQKQQLDTLKVHDAEIQKDLDALAGVETSNALTFRNQLIAEQLVLRVEIDDVTFRIEQLNEYIAHNF